ncbi:MAG: hypothetical protein KBD25_04775 [Rickettsiaceae bacterium]|nr:hypothetical protein [Rickettsiaceae bacterium]
MSKISTESNKIFLDEITPDLAVNILKKLCNQNPELIHKAQACAVDDLSNIDIDKVAQNVFSDLDCIDVHDLWARSGPSAYGYHDPGEMAFEMVEEVIEVHINKMREYRALHMSNDEMKYCVGIIKGLYLFDTESKSEFSDWAPDVASETYSSVLDDWEEHSKDQNLNDNINLLIKNHCPGWE